MVAKSLLIVTPVFNDWVSFGALLAEIDKAVPAWNMNVDVIAVDDGSSQTPQIQTAVDALRNIRDVTIVSLAANLGHQRAIAAGAGPCQPFWRGMISVSSWTATARIVPKTSRRCCKCLSQIRAPWSLQSGRGDRRTGVSARSTRSTKRFFTC